MLLLAGLLMALGDENGERRLDAQKRLVATIISHIPTRRQFRSLCWFSQDERRPRM